MDGSMIRTTEEILNDLRRIENQLSPEKLCHDGELSKAETRRRYWLLIKRQNELIVELGRDPTDAELYPSQG